MGIKSRLILPQSWSRGNLLEVLYDPIPIIIDKRARSHDVKIQNKTLFLDQEKLFRFLVRLSAAIPIRD